jgi:nucleoside-diphosphate-sugar epimerase
MKILVTGSSGFIGVAIVEHLVASGHEVIGLHAHAKTDTSDMFHRDVVADIASAEDIARLSKDIAPCDAIIHAAASLDMGLHSTEISRVNCMGLQNMLWLSLQWRKNRFIFLSSLPVIGTPRILPIREDHPVQPLTAYHASKLFGEQIVRLAEKQGVTTMSLRLTAPVGPRIPKNRLLSVFVRRALNGEPLEVSGQGTRKQNYIDVRDIAKATELCLQGNASGVYNIAASSSISNVDLAKLCIARCDSSSATQFNGRDDHEDGYVWDISIEKARTELGFVPKFDINDAIDAAKADLAENDQGKQLDD